MTYDREKMKEVEQMHDGDIADTAWAALRLAQRKLAPEEWAVAQIERALTGDVAGAAFVVAIEGFRSTDSDWLIKQLDRNIGTVAGTILWLLQQDVVSSEWAMQRIEQATDNSVASAASYMACRKLAPVEWAVQQIERGIGDVDDAAYTLARAGLVSPEWAIKQIEKHTGKSILFWERGHD